MRMNFERVLRAFEQGRSAVGDARHSCSTDGTTIYSYHMPIARRAPDGKVYVVPYTKAPSATTRSQVRAVSVYFRGRTIESAALGSASHASRAIRYGNQAGVYKIVRYYMNGPKRVVARGLTLAQAQAHCCSPETSSRTATSRTARTRTRTHGPWFDGYTAEK